MHAELIETEDEAGLIIRRAVAAAAALLLLGTTAEAEQEFEDAVDAAAQRGAFMTPPAGRPLLTQGEPLGR